MLQRSQTLYLLGVFLLTILMLTGPIADLVGEAGVLTLRHSGIFTGQGEKLEFSTWPLTLLFALVLLLAFLNIFSYKHRMRQMRLCVFLILISIGMMAMMFYYTWAAGNNFEITQTLYKWRFVIPPIAIILQYLAFRRIRRDELLVKAYDRIR